MVSIYARGTFITTVSSRADVDDFARRPLNCERVRVTFRGGALPPADDVRALADALAKIVRLRAAVVSFRCDSGRSSHLDVGCWKRRDETISTLGYLAAEFGRSHRHSFVHFLHLGPGAATPHSSFLRRDGDNRVARRVLSMLVRFR